MRWLLCVVLLVVMALMMTGCPRPNTRRRDPLAYPRPGEHWDPPARGWTET